MDPAVCTSLVVNEYKYPFVPSCAAPNEVVNVNGLLKRWINTGSIMEVDANPLM